MDLTYLFSSLGPLHHWQQDSAYPEGQGHGPPAARGYVLPDQEGCLYQEASGEKQEGQRRQVQADSCREQNPQIGQVRILSPLISAV